MSIVRTIIEQLTPGTIYMLGGKDTVESIEEGRGIRFAVKGSPTRINRLEIVLAPDDTYTMRFKRLSTTRRSLKIETKAELDGIYFDQLHDVIERHTGLVSRFPRVHVVSAR